MWVPKPAGQQVGKAGEDLPLRGGVREAVIEADVEDERLACCIADGPKIAESIGPKKRLREMPDFTRERELLRERMRNRKGLSELASPDTILGLKRGDASAIRFIIS